MPRNRRKESELVMLARALEATEQQDFIDAGVCALGSLVNGASAVSYIRMFPSAANESVQDILRKVNLRQKKGRKQ